MEEEARKILLEVLGIEATDICDTLSVNAIPQWDSASHIGLMLELESRWQIEITEAAIIQCATFKGLTAFLSSLPRCATATSNKVI
jgi:acyl carrier protein